ncbi:MAG: hypothetical protein ACLR0P_10075 [Oscillospiraceae bacterium]
MAMFSYHSDGATQTLFEGTVTDTNFHVDFNNPSTNIKVSVSGGSIVKQEIFARAVDLVLSAGTKTVTITGERMSEVKDVRVTQVNQNGEVDEEKNPLISNETMRSALRTTLSSTLRSVTPTMSSIVATQRLKWVISSRRRPTTPPSWTHWYWSMSCPLRAV